MGEGDVKGCGSWMASRKYLRSISDNGGNVALGEALPHSDDRNTKGAR